MDEKFYNRVSGDRLSSRQVDELVGLAKGIAADGKINVTEVEFLQKWLGTNLHITDNPVVATLYRRVGEILSDGIVDEDEKTELLDTLNRLSPRDFELGETLKATTLPLCDPAPDLVFPGKRFTFTGTFTYGQRKDCESVVQKRGATTGSITKTTDYLIIGTYATDSWKHSSFGNKIMKACDYRDKGVPISIVSEKHWQKFL
ncbi:MAG: BRCT domain-containing protein [Parvularculaceae bacterium]